MSQPYLASAANSPSTAQEIMSTQYVPAFASLNMWEDCGGGLMFCTDNTLTFGMAAKPSRIGSTYVAGADGGIRSATTDNSTFLQWQNAPVGATSRARIYAARQPSNILLNGIVVPKSTWSYNSSAGEIDVGGLGPGTVLARFGQ
jgi:hypothetical protein